MATNANIGLLVPGNFGVEPPTMVEFTQFFSRAEELGFHSLWTIDRIFHEVNILDPMTLLSCAAAVTSRIRLGTSVLLFVLRNPCNSQLYPSSWVDERRGVKAKRRAGRGLGGRGTGRPLKNSAWLGNRCALTRGPRGRTRRPGDPETRRHWTRAS